MKKSIGITDALKTVFFSLFVILLRITDYNDNFSEFIGNLQRYCSA